MKRNVFLIILMLLALAACARQSREPDSSGVEISLTPQPEPPVVGDATLLITLADETGNPIEDARLDVKGDMSHAGMEPVLAEVAGGPRGVYVVPFTWTMGGDWFVTVDATLADGTIISRRFDLSVGGEMDMDQ